MNSIRPASAVEIPALNTLIAASARELSRGFYTQAQIDALIAHVFGVDTQLVADGTYYVVERDSRFLACGGWSARETLFGGDQAKSGADPLLDPACDAARIRAFFVHPDAARQGLGAQLLAHCESHARNGGFARAELMATLPGVPFYTERGYRADGKVTLNLPGEVEIQLVPMSRNLISP